MVGGPVPQVWGWRCHEAGRRCCGGSSETPCLADPKVLPGSRRVLGFSPVIIDRHVSRFLLTFLTDDLGGL